jgi:hypothetical protein
MKSLTSQNNNDNRVLYLLKNFTFMWLVRNVLVILHRISKET